MEHIGGFLMIMMMVMSNRPTNLNPNKVLGDGMLEREVNDGSRCTYKHPLEDHILGMIGQGILTSFP